MSTHYADSSHRACPDCGGVAENSAHVCDAGRALDWLMLGMQDGIDRFEEDFRSYLETAHGQLAQWLAERKRIHP